MNIEATIFKRLLLSKIKFFETSGYNFLEEIVYNEGDSEEYSNFYFYNKVLKKKLAFTFYSSLGHFLKNEINVLITENDSTSINLPLFLAYQELKKRIAYEDREKYRFKVDPKNLETSINSQLQRVMDILTTDMRELFITEEWMNIPTHHPMEDYK